MKTQNLKTTQLFQTKEEIDHAVLVLKEGRVNPFWQLMCRILDGNIEEVTKVILDPPEGVEEKDIDRFRENLKIMKDIRNTPEKMIEIFTTSNEVDTEEIDIDEIYE